jgi:hypothetical protein
MFTTNRLSDWMTITFIALGLIAIYRMIRLLVAWKTIGTKLSDDWSKSGTEVIQWIAGLCGVFATFAPAPEDKATWKVPAIVSLTCLMLWKLLQHLVDHRIRAAEKTGKSQFEAAKRESRFRTDLLAAFRSFVIHKEHRTMDVLRKRKSTASIVQARNALSPEEHLRTILSQFLIFLKEITFETTGRVPNIRIGVYVLSPETQAMSPIHSLSLNQTLTKPFSSYQQHTEGFQIANNDRMSHVVKCVREKQQIIIVEDCEYAASEGKFHFYSDEQREYLKSLVVHYLGEVCLPDGTLSKGAISVDSDSRGIFKESDRDDLLLALLEFSERIKFEMLLKALLEPPGVDP